MPGQGKQTLENLRQQVEQTTNVMASATMFINGVAQRIQDAVTRATENGATSDELQPVQAEVDALRDQSKALADAIVANSPESGPIQNQPDDQSGVTSSDAADGNGPNSSTDQL